MAEYGLYLRDSLIEKARQDRGISREQELLASIEYAAGRSSGSFVAGDKYYENKQMPTWTMRKPKQEQTVDGDRVELDELMKEGE